MSEKVHPEQKDNEFFAGNTEDIGSVPDYLSQLKTARVGTQAFYLDGKKIPAGQMRPLFIGDIEAGEHDRIMTIKTFGRYPA